MMLANQNLAQMVVSYMFQAPFVSTMIPQKPGTRLASDEGNETGQTIVGSRVLGIEIKKIGKHKKFEPLDEKKQYRMATNDFLVAGGDGYDMLGGEREEGISLDSVLIEYLKKCNQLAVVSCEQRRLI